MMAEIQILVERARDPQSRLYLSSKIHHGSNVVDVQILDLKLSKFSLLRRAKNGLNSFDKFEISGDSNLYTTAGMEKFIQLVHYQRGQEMRTSAYCETGGCSACSTQSTLKSGLDFHFLKTCKSQLDSQYGKIGVEILHMPKTENF